jgi:hypothetical protein
MTFKLFSAISAVVVFLLTIGVNFLYIKMTNELFYKTNKRSQYYKENVKDLSKVLNPSKGKANIGNANVKGNIRM